MCVPLLPVHGVLTHPHLLTHATHPVLALLTRVESSLSTQTHSFALTHYTVKSSITRFFFARFVFHFNPQLIFVFFVFFFLNSIIINIVQNVTKKKKCTLGLSWVFLYKAGRSGLLRLPVFVPFSSIYSCSTLAFFC